MFLQFLWASCRVTNPWPSEWCLFGPRRIKFDGNLDETVQDRPLDVCWFLRLWICLFQCLGRPGRKYRSLSVFVGNGYGSWWCESMQHVWQEKQTTQSQKIFAGSTWELECGTVFPTVQFSIVCTTFAMCAGEDGAEVAIELLTGNGFWWAIC